MIDRMSLPPFRYRLAAIDIDDTLVGPNKQVSRENHEAIRARPKPDARRARKHWLPRGSMRPADRA